MSSSHLSPPFVSRGKRSRSNSSSSTSSSSATSSTGASIFSRFTSTDSANSLSSCSSPEGSNDASPYQDGQVEERRCKLLKTDAISSPDRTLDNLGQKCSLDVASTISRPVSASCGKNFFVDCLVDATVHLLDIIWEGPLQRAITFVCQEIPSASSSFLDDIVRQDVCPIGRNISQQAIPVELFVRETLRRSRTSCSTLQAALLFCKRVGGEVVRQRAQRESVVLTAEQLEKLPGSSSSYPSLSSNSGDSQSDYILCDRRVFLASVMVSSKFLQDRTFSNKAWSKISGLSVKEISQVERRLLKALEFDLSVGESTWTSWTTFLQSQWKAGGPMARSGFLHSNSLSAAQIAITRNVLARTQSLPEGHKSFVDGEILDADVVLPSGDQHAFFTNSDRSLTASSPLNIGEPSPATNLISVEADVSTPTMSRTLASGETTPTFTTTNRTVAELSSRKAGQSLLSTAIHNHHIQACSC